MSHVKIGIFHKLSLTPHFSRIFCAYWIYDQHSDSTERIIIMDDAAWFCFTGNSFGQHYPNFDTSTACHLFCKEFREKKKKQLQIWWMLSTVINERYSDFQLVFHSRTEWTLCSLSSGDHGCYEYKAFKHPAIQNLRRDGWEKRH